jgi:flagellar hook-associated protein 2
MATTSTNFISALGTGSGVDIKTLAQNLVDAERVPKQEIIQARIDKAELRISGYSTVIYALDQLKSALEGLKSPAAFQGVTAASSQPSVVSVSASGAASTGSYEVEVSRLALAQRSVSDGFASKTASVLQNPSSVSAVDIQLMVGGVTQTRITGVNPTLEDIADAINGANQGVKASVIDTGDSAGFPFRLVLQGETGLAGSFELDLFESGVTPDEAVDSSLGFIFPPSDSRDFDRAATDAAFTVDGIPYERSTNAITDAIEGATLNLLGITNSAVTVSTARDTTPVKEKIQQIVSAYNDLDTILDAAENRDSTVERLGGSLAGDGTARRIRDQVRTILMPAVGDLGNSTTDPLTDLRQLGLFVDTDGQMKFSSVVEGASSFATMFQVGSQATLDRVLSERYDDLAALFSGDAGIARDMADQISGSGEHFDTLAWPSSPTKLVQSQSRNASQKILVDKDRLVDLEDRMKTLLERYLKQFAVMESLVGESKSLRTSVENSFKAMSNVR